MIPYLIREYKEQDFSHVHSSWLKSSRIHNPASRKVPLGIYNTHMGVDVTRLIGKSNILCAVAQAEPDIILSYIAYMYLHGDIPIINYMHTKQIYQRYGLAKALLHTAFSNTDFISATFYTTDFDIFFLKKNKDKETHKIIYNPYLLKEIE